MYKPCPKDPQSTSWPWDLDHWVYKIWIKKPSLKSAVLGSISLSTSFFPQWLFSWPVVLPKVHQFPGTKGPWWARRVPCRTWTFGACGSSLDAVLCCTSKGEANASTVWRYGYRYYGISSIQNILSLKDCRVFQNQRWLYWILWQLHYWTLTGSCFLQVMICAVVMGMASMEAKRWIFKRCTLWWEPSSNAEVTWCCTFLLQTSSDNFRYFSENVFWFVFVTWRSCSRSASFCRCKVVRTHLGFKINPMTSHHTTPHRIASHHITSPHSTAHRIVSYPILSYPIISVMIYAHDCLLQEGTSGLSSCSLMLNGFWSCLALLHNKLNKNCYYTTHPENSLFFPEYPIERHMRYEYT